MNWTLAATDDDPSVGQFSFTVTAAGSSGGGFGVYLLWAVALAIPAAIFLRPGAKKSGKKKGSK